MTEEAVSRISQLEQVQRKTKVPRTASPASSFLVSGGVLSSEGVESVEAWDTSILKDEYRKATVSWFKVSCNCVKLDPQYAVTAKLRMQCVP
jgi:hypothetical protein